MTRLYSDENFPLPIVIELRKLGHDVLTALEAGQANQGIPDLKVLAYAANGQRVLLTNDRDFIKLHKSTSLHCGIVFCTDDPNVAAVAQRVHSKILASLPLDNKLLRVYRPAQP